MPAWSRKTEVPAYEVELGYLPPVKRLGSLATRIDKAQHEKMAKTAAHAASVQKYEEGVQKLQAKKALREALIKKERDEFNSRQAKVIAAVTTSERSGRVEVIDDSVIEAAIASGGNKKKR